MLNNRPLIIAGAVILVLSIVIGGLAIFQGNRSPEDPTDNGEAIEGNENTDYSPSTGDDFYFEHYDGDSLIDFEAGNDVFLDESLVAYLSRMETGTPVLDENGNYSQDEYGELVYDKSREKDLDSVLDNLILLINHFASKGYSEEASHQIQRFYVMYYNRFGGASFNDLASKIERCFPKNGASPESLADSISNVFGFNRGDRFAFVFQPFEVAEINPLFCDVLPANVTLGEDLELYCIYEDWHSDENTEYERNLEGWLHNVIRVVDEAELAEEHIIVAEILFAGSLADAAYRSDWAEALVRCMTIEEMNYDGLRSVVQIEFGVDIQTNVPLQDYFDAIGSEVRE